MNEKTDNKWNDIVARYYGDTEFARKLDASPTATLKEEGFEMPENVEIKMHKNSAHELHFVMPPDPTSELSESMLKNVAAGSYCCGPCCENCNKGCNV